MNKEQIKKHLIKRIDQQKELSNHIPVDLEYDLINFLNTINKNKTIYTSNTLINYFQQKYDVDLESFTQRGHVQLLYDLNEINDLNEWYYINKDWRLKKIDLNSLQQKIEDLSWKDKSLENVYDKSLTFKTLDELKEYLIDQNLVSKLMQENLFFNISGLKNIVSTWNNGTKEFVNNINQDDFKTITNIIGSKKVGTYLMIDEKDKKNVLNFNDLETILKNTKQKER